MSLPVAILAGGLATRLRPLTERIPKSLVEVAGKPFAEQQVELLREHGLRRIVFCVGHLGQRVEAALGDGSRWGVSLGYAFDGPTLLGTGGALRQALPLLGEAFLVLYGDSYLECDYAAVERAFVASGSLGLMTVYRNEGRLSRSNALYERGLVRCYDKRHPTPEMQHIDYGLGALHARALQAYAPGLALDLAAVYADLAARGQLAGWEVAERYYEIGSPGGLEETRHHLTEGEKRWSAV